ncbi:MAG: isoprenyl transferase [Pirellula sp.]
MAIFGRNKRKAKFVLSPENLDPKRVPKHVAIIMDGNGRWAKSRGLPRIEGHRQGANSVEEALTACGELGIPYLTLYCFSNENWKRPKDELDFLMGLLKTYLIQQTNRLIDHGVRLMVIGRRDGLSKDVLDGMEQAIERCKEGTKQTLILAINYGARQEIVDAVQEISREVVSGRLNPESITEQTISEHLYTRNIPDPDLLIRTSGELRISNFLLWQISYSEIWITPKAWPEFGKPDLYEAVAEYTQRDRRFGGLS